jgi:polysaccharide chain length determinant protein (PEP-CTERM system associated)
MKKNGEKQDIAELMDLFQERSGSRKSALDPAYLFELVLHYRWLIIIPFCLTMLVGIYLAVTLPRIYETDTLILVREQQVSDSFVQSIVDADIESRISTIRQQIMSRTNLLSIIEEFNLFSSPEDRARFTDDKIADMRGRISVKAVESTDKRSANAFRISYRADQPNQVFQVVNALTTYVIDQNLKYRESHAAGTSEFLDDELIKMRERLVRVEQVLEDFRNKHMGELPEQLSSNLLILNQLQQQTNELQQNLRDQQNRLLAIENQLKFIQQQAAAPPGATSVAGGLSELAVLKKRLADYRARYTEDHPDVVQLKSQISELEKEQPEESEAPPVEKTLSTADSRLKADLIMQRDQVLVSIESIKGEIAQIQSRIEFYQQRVENTPKREQELLSLKRDYENMQKIYDSVLTRKLEADIAVNMERKQKGEQFQVLDPPRRPNKPISPDMRKLFVGCLFAGLLIGGGLIFLLEFLDNSVKKSDTLRERLDIPVLVVMPVIESPARRMLRRLNNGLSICGVLAAVAAAAGLAAVTVAEVPPVVEKIKSLPFLG